MTGIGLIQKVNVCRETKCPTSDQIDRFKVTYWCGNHPAWLGVRVLWPDHNSGLVMTPLDNNLAGLHQSDNTAAAAAGLLITTAQIIHFTAQFAQQFFN